MLLLLVGLIALVCVAGVVAGVVVMTTSKSAEPVEVLGDGSDEYVVTLRWKSGRSMAGSRVFMGTQYTTVRSDSTVLVALPAGDTREVTFIHYNQTSYDPPSTFAVSGSVTLSNGAPATATFQGHAPGVADAVLLAAADGTTLNWTWSMMPAGCNVLDVWGSNTTTSEWGEVLENGMSFSDFHDRIDATLNAWSAAVAQEHGVTINWSEIEESDIRDGGSGTIGTDVGDFRFGMTDNIGEDGVLAIAFFPGAIGKNEHNCVIARYLDVAQTTPLDWGADNDVDDPNDGADGVAGRYSVEYVIGHELGHAFGLAHNVDPGAFMYAYAGQDLQLGDSSIKDFAADMAALSDLYNRESLADGNATSRDTSRDASSGNPASTTSSPVPEGRTCILRARGVQR